MHVLFEAKIRDWTVYCLFIYIVLSDIFFILALFNSAYALIFGIPLLVLNIFFYKLFRCIFFAEVVLYDAGLKLKGKFFLWDKIKSISFSSGRFRDETFWRGIKLPAIQQLYLLDKEGNESSGIIDIDHVLKSDRARNNMIRMGDQLHILGKYTIISDWAQKR